MVHAGPCEGRNSLVRVLDLEHSMGLQFRWVRSGAQACLMCFALANLADFDGPYLLLFVSHVCVYIGVRAHTHARTHARTHSACSLLTSLHARSW